MLVVDGMPIEVRRGSDPLGDRAWYLWEPASRSLFGGVLLFEGLHVWTADTATSALRAEWIRVLDDLLALSPAFVVAGHRAAGGPERYDGDQPYPRVPRAVRGARGRVS